MMPDDDHMLMMSALNMATVSIYRITSSGDRAVLDREYEGIISNINLDAINADDNLIKLYRQIAEAIKTSWASDKEREAIEERSSEQKHKSIGDIISGKILGTFKINPLEWLGDLAMSSASEYFRSRIQPDKEEALRKIQQTELDGYHKLNSQLFEASARLIGTHRISSSTRITPPMLDALSKAISQPDPNRRHRMLRDLERMFSFYPPYWFYRAKAAQESNNHGEAEKCFKRFDEVWRPVLVQDPYKVEALKYRIGELMKDDSGHTHKKEILECLHEMKLHIPHKDWANYIFLGMIYFSLGCKEEAVNCVMHNLDFDYEQDLSNNVLLRIESSDIGEGSHGEIVDGGNGEIVDGGKKKLLPPQPTVTPASQPEEKKSIMDRILAMLRSKRAEPPATDDEEPVYVGISSKEEPETKPVRRDKIWKLAEKGDARMQFVLALNFYSGRGCEQDYVVAVKWFRKAAEQGHTEAQVRLGDAYYKGEGVEQDYAEALKWYRKAADKGHAKAQNYVGFAYSHGEGVKQDKAEAAKWFRKSAEQGYAKAQFNLATMYDNGKGVKQDKAEAVKWYRKAAEQGHVKAQYNLAYMYDKGEGIKQDKAEAAKWYRKAAEQGHAWAQNNLGVMLDTGDGIKQNKEEAVKYYRLSAEQGNPNAQYNLGTMYEDGEGVEKDRAEAVRWYRKAAQQGYKPAQKKLKALHETW